MTGSYDEDPKAVQAELKPSGVGSNEMPRSDRFVSREGDFQIISDPEKQQKAVEIYKQQMLDSESSKEPNKDELYEAAEREVRADHEEYLDEWAKQVREFLTKRADIRGGDSRDVNNRTIGDSSISPVIDIKDRPPPAANPKELLEGLDLDEDLARLEKLAGQFNIFEAVGMVRQEIRHSHLLAWLLNPLGNHGLRDSFLKAFLQRTSDKTESSIDIDPLDFSATEVRREWKNIDISLVDHSNKFVCVIENKVDSGEHSNQLFRYRQVVSGDFPDYAHHYVLLNVTGEQPSDREYVGVTYRDVCEVVENLVETRAQTIDSEVTTALTHYVTMIRRHIMPDTEIQQLSRQIYRKHQAALDLIYEHRPDLQALIRDILVEVIGAEPAFTLDDSNKKFIRFRPDSWDRPELRGGHHWTKSGVIVLFEFWNSTQWNTRSLGLWLHLGPADENIRRQVYEAATAAGSPFAPIPDGLARRHVRLFQKDILSTGDWDDLEESLDSERIRARLQEAWSSLTSNELPPMIKVIDRLFPEA